MTDFKRLASGHAEGMVEGSLLERVLNAFEHISEKMSELGLYWRVVHRLPNRKHSGSNGRGGEWGGD